MNSCLNCRWVIQNHSLTFALENIDNSNSRDRTSHLKTLNETLLVMMKVKVLEKRDEFDDCSAIEDRMKPTDFHRPKIRQKVNLR